MSSDESASTQISIISSQNGREQKLKTHKSEQWEINLVGNFLLSLYHRILITPQNNWMINKTDMRKEFKNFLTIDLCRKIKELNGTDNIGTLLHRCGFILNTPRGSSFYQIKSLAIFEFRNKKLKEQDNWRINNDLNKISENDNNGVDNILSNLMPKQPNMIILDDNFVVDPDEPKNPLEYQGTTMQQRLANYCPTNVGCCICQEDFSTMEQFEDHIIKHNDESEFEYLNSMSKFNDPIFTLSYRLCKKSHYFCFDINTKTENLIIEKIIIVQSRSLYYVHNTRVPYSMPDTGCEQFFVDCHLFTIYMEQPIILICHLKDNKETRIIEQHHFMRCVEFPKVNFAINPSRLPDKKTFKPVFKLADYFPPKEIRDALKDDFYNEKLMKVSNEFRDYIRNEKKLQPQTIGPSLNILLQIEDLDTLKQYFNLTQRNVKIRSFGSDYSIKLRPQQRIFIENVLTVFDELILTSRSDISTKPEDLMHLMLQNRDDITRMKNTFVGQIENVNTGRISFKCYQKIDVKKTYTVICRPSRLNIRYQYRSLEMLPTTMPFLMKFLFPAQLISRPLSNLSLSLYNLSINSNPEQLQAVRNIADGPRNDATYVVFGPPGTGKTTTIVEAILQVLKREGTKILVTSSSNSACDEVALRLCQKLGQLDMSRAIVRIYSRSSETRFDNIDDELIDHSNMYNGQFYPDVEILHEYRIVVCTLSVVAKLTTGKFGRQENNKTLYTHLFIDEIAASMEAEALVAITTILTPKSSLIIAGDHKQLGPILQSKRAEELGLGVSLLERLLARECYRVNTDTGDYDRTIQTRLRLNYRSHPDIVNLFSGMYYNHDLEPKANLDDVSVVKHWHLAHNKEYPIIFHCVEAPSRCDNQSQSLYNIQELHVVMDYVKDLMYFGINGYPVKETDIGIISPYKKQYKRIQEELNLRKWFKIETGSVETFQGKEKNIIIVSFVRSGTRTLGFLENPRRLNVTISRAKSLLIMIGNPHTLSLNGDFAYIIKECQRHKTIVGSASLSGDAKNQQHKRLTGSTEKLNNNRREHNTTRREQNVQKQTLNTATSGDLSKASTLNESMQKLNVKDNSNRARRRRRGDRARNSRAGSKSKNGQPSHDINKEYNMSDNDDDDDDDVSIADTIASDSRPSTSKAAVKEKQQDIKNIRSREYNRRKGNTGKVTKSYNKSKQNSNKSTDTNKIQQKTKTESLFDELPQVPKITSNKDDENTIKTTAVLQKTPGAQVMPLMQLHPQYLNNQQHQQQQYFINQQQQYLNNQQQNVFMHKSMTNRPMNPTATHFGQYNHMPVQMQYNGSLPHYPQQQLQQHNNSYGFNQSMSYHPQLNVPTTTHIPFQNNNMQPAFKAHNTNTSNMNTTNHSNQKSLGSVVTESNTNINKTSANQKSSTNLSNTENKTLKAESDLGKNTSDSNKKMSNNKNNSISKTSNAKLNDQTALDKNRNSIKNKDPNSNLANATKSSNNQIIAENKASLTNWRNTSNVRLSHTTSTSTSSSKSTNLQSTGAIKKLSTSTTSSTSSIATANVSPIIRSISTVAPATISTTSTFSSGSSLAHNSTNKPLISNYSRNSSNTTTESRRSMTPVPIGNTASSTAIQSPIAKSHVRPIISSTSTVTPATTATTFTASSGSSLAHTSTNKPLISNYSRNSSYTTTESRRSMTPVPIGNTASSTAIKSPIAKSNVRPIISSTSTVTPATIATTYTVSSGSSLAHTSTNKPLISNYSRNSSNTTAESRRSMTPVHIGNTTPSAPEIVNRPVNNYSGNHFNAPELRTPDHVYVYGENRRPVRNLRFDNQNPSSIRKAEEKKCIIS